MLMPGFHENPRDEAGKERRLICVARMQRDPPGGGSRWLGQMERVKRRWRF